MGCVILHFLPEIVAVADKLGNSKKRTDLLR